jgi:hypothetical protein
MRSSLILFTTQLVVFEMLVRNFVDAVYGSSARFRRAVGGDPRRFYYPFMVLLAIVISIIIFQALPTEPRASRHRLAPRAPCPCPASGRATPCCPL